MDNELLETNNEVANEKFEYVNNYNFFLLNRTLYALVVYCTSMYGNIFTSLVKGLFGVLKSRIPDGYWLTFLSPFVLLSWIFASVVTAVYSVIAIPIIIPLSLFVIPASIWGLLFELPAGFINKRKDLHVKHYNTTLTIYYMAETIMGIITLVFVVLALLFILLFNWPVVIIPIIIFLSSLICISVEFARNG